MTARELSSARLENASPAPRRRLRVAAVGGIGLAAGAAVVVSMAAGVGSANAATATPGLTGSGTVALDDSMNRTVASGLGSAPTGGAYSVYGGNYSVAGGDAHVSGINPGSSTVATAPVKGVGQRSRLVFSLPALPAGGSGTYIGLMLRREANGDAVVARVKVLSTGVAYAQLRVTQGGTDTAIGADYQLPFTLGAGRNYYLSGFVGGTSSVSAGVRVWSADDDRPEWQNSATATVGAGLNQPGSTAVYVYHSGTATAPLALDIHGLKVRTYDGGTTTPPTSTPPTTTPPTTTPPTSTPPTTTPPTSTPPSTTPPPASTRPDASNTGVPAGTPLTVVNGDVTITTPGTVLANQDIHGLVRILADNVTVKNCIVRGGASAPSTFRGLIEAYWRHGVVIQDTEIVPTAPGLNDGMGIGGSGMTVQRVHIHGTVDGVDVYDSNTVVKDSYIHGLVTYNNDPQHGGGITHNDAVQIFAGAGVQLTNNTLMGGSNSAVQLSPGNNMTLVTGFTMSGNYFDGGACSVNLAHNSLPGVAQVTMTNNKFGANQTIKNCGIVVNQSLIPLVNTANVWAVNGTAVAPNRGA